MDKEGKARLSLQITRTRMDVSHENIKFKYDSQNGKIPDGEAGKILSNYLVLAKHDVGVVVDPYGLFSDLAIPKQMLESFRSETDPRKDIEDNFFNVLRYVFPAFPRNKINIGDSWKQTSAHKIPAIDEGTIESEYSHVGQCAKKNLRFEHVSIKPFVNLLFKTPSSKDKYRITATRNKGDAYFHCESGWLAEMQKQLVITAQGIGGEVRMDHEIIVKGK